MFAQTHLKRMLAGKTLFALFVLTLGIVFVSAAQATPAIADCEPVVVVTNNADSGAGSLRQAITDVCDGGDITFSLPLPATIYLTSAELTIDKPLSIHGPGANLLTVNGNHARRIFNVSGVGVFIDGLAIRAGATHGDGGGIYSTGMLTLSHSAVLGNLTPDTDARGGGIFNSGTLTVTNSTFSGNTASLGDGGGIYSTGSVNVSASTFADNVAGFAGGLCNNGGLLTISYSDFNSNDGGGIGNLSGISGSSIRHTTIVGNAGHGISSSGMLVVSNSTIAGNVTPYYGGGIDNGYGTLTVSDSVISGNTAQYGGGIRNYLGGVLNVNNSTISGNIATYCCNHGGGINNLGTLTISNSTTVGNTGGGINWYPEMYTPPVTLNNSIIANNLSGNDCSGNSITSAGYNLDSDGTCNLTGAGDLPNTDPILGPLQDNGGETETHALLTGSPAIDAGDNANCPPTDQRGVLRPQGPACDIGAYEAEPTGVSFYLSKEASNAFPLSGEPLLYTIRVYNGGFQSTTTAAVSDMLPEGLTFAGPVTLTPPQPDAILAQSAEDLPALAQNLIITNSQAITLTLPVTVNMDTPVGTLITNTAAVTSTEVVIPTFGSSVIKVCGTVIVTNTADNGPGSLRWAIADVCDGYTVTFDLPTPAIIVLTSGQLNIAKPLTIQGPGADLLAISGNHNSRVFNISGNGVYIDGLTVRDGSDAGSSGGIYNNGVLFLSHCLITGNTAYYAANGINNYGTLSVSYCTITNNTGGQVGGGISNNGTLTVTYSTFSDNEAFLGGAIATGGSATLDAVVISGNSASLEGGGVYNDGDLTINDSLITQNSSADGGGIRNFGSEANLYLNNTRLVDNHGQGGGGVSNVWGSVTLDHSTVDDNSAADGGGLWNGTWELPFPTPESYRPAQDEGGTYIVRNSTISNNVAAGRGGGINNVVGTVMLTNSTLAGNTANIAGGGIHNDETITVTFSTLSGNAAPTGGGIYLGGVNAMTTMDNTIVANNLSGNDCYGAITSLGHNLDSDGSCSLTGPGDLPNTDPLLGPLQDNGGATFTQALLIGSPAMDSGDNDTCPDADQRGVARPKGLGCDRGAYEAVNILVRMNYQYWMNDGSADNGRYTLLADATYVDESSRTGVWQYQATPAPRLLLRYDPGFGCRALSIGYFTAPGQVRGWRICQDGSGAVGYWAGGILPAALALPR